MPKRVNGKNSTDKLKSEIEKQTLVNLTEVLIYFDHMSKKTFFEMIRESNPPFPDKVTPTMWTLRSIQEWEKINERLSWWVNPDDPDPDTDDDNAALERFDKKVAA